MKKEERREYHKRWRDNTDREKFLEGQRRRHRAWYYRHLEKNRKKAKVKAAEYRKRHADDLRERAYKRWFIQSRRNARFVTAYKLTRGCVDCGQSDPLVLDFDHVRGKKLGRVSSMRAQGWPLPTIIKEIEKCELRCANCHRRRHNV